MDGKLLKWVICWYHGRNIWFDYIVSTFLWPSPDSCVLYSWDLVLNVSWCYFQWTVYIVQKSWIRFPKDETKPICEKYWELSITNVWIAQPSVPSPFSTTCWFPTIHFMTAEPWQTKQRPFSNFSSDLIYIKVLQCNAMYMQCIDWLCNAMHCNAYIGNVFRVLCWYWQMAPNSR